MSAFEILPTLGQTAAEIAVTGTTARVAIPQAERPRAFRLSATVAMRIQPGTVSVNATATSVLRLAAEESIDMRFRSDDTHIAAIAEGGGGVLVITPLLS